MLPMLGNFLLPVWPAPKSPLTSPIKQRSSLPTRGDPGF
jgi:hypothetical protein